jgi:hypothetical protein
MILKKLHKNLHFFFKDSTHALKSIEESEQTFKSFLGEHERIIYDIRQCPVKRMTLCVTSDAEYEKCVKMRVSPTTTHVIPNFLFSHVSDRLESSTRPTRHVVPQSSLAH